MIHYFDLKRVNDRNRSWADEAHRVLDGGWYLKGEATRRFEEAYARYIGTKHCVGCGNGLDALSLILRAYKELGVMTDGDEVIVPANTYIASVLAITGNRLVPVFVEPDADTLQIDDSRMAEAVGPRTRAVMIVHLYGRCAYTERIAEVCRRHGLKLIEDNAQAHGCTYGRHRTGSLGDAAGHSFYPTKNLGAMGDAGAVTTDDDSLADMIAALGNYGSRRKYVFDHEGRNSRMDEVQAAILHAKLQHLDDDNRLRKSIADSYLQRIDNPDVTCSTSGRDCVWHIFPVFSPRRDSLQEHLLRRGIETQIHYPVPPHRQRCYARWQHLSLPVTERIHATELSLPCNPALTAEETDAVVDAVNAFRP